MSQICQSRLSILPNKKLTAKNLPRLVNFCQNGEISTNLVTLMAGDNNFIILFAGSSHPEGPIYEEVDSPIQTDHFYQK